MQTHNVTTSIREAFIGAFSRAKAVKAGPVVDKVLAALDTKAGIVKRNDWNAHLSFKTAVELKKKGILVA